MAEIKEIQADIVAMDATMYQEDQEFLHKNVVKCEAKRHFKSDCWIGLVTIPQKVKSIKLLELTEIVKKVTNRDMTILFGADGKSHKLEFAPATSNKEYWPKDPKDGVVFIDFGSMKKILTAVADNVYWSYIEFGGKPPVDEEQEKIAADDRKKKLSRTLIV